MNTPTITTDSTHKDAAVDEAGDMDDDAMNDDDVTDSVIRDHSSSSAAVSGGGSSSSSGGPSSSSSRIKRVREELDNDEGEGEDEGEEEEGTKPEHALTVVPTGEPPSTCHEYISF